MNGNGPALVRGQEAPAPRGWKKALIPEDPSERAQIRFQLAKVGFDRPDSVELFFILRLALALFTPAMVFCLMGLSQTGLLPGGLDDLIGKTSRLSMMQIAAIFAAVGFYVPGYWLKQRINYRRHRITIAFPNAMDLIQISVQAGMGFDSAVARVAHELDRVSPELAYELSLLQMETQAGRDRETALFDMAERMGIEEAKSFALVIVQSMQFGTSLTAALKSYAAEMRQMRELAAQEKANKLPVQMSAVMSVLMLPALFLITLTPIIIRYIEVG
ncbi:type II secretion system F family protein [Roseovarius arcticus]|uniref:type II secretion system F family protein n=1 Tax=Roseovarius arcticus TaxID=2547404 RepID=UPI0014866F66|nr:type II secretion system F family protein [Roseovarius arcticus]